jgi:NADH-quinone oxidoreductase subunit K
MFDPLGPFDVRTALAFAGLLMALGLAGLVRRRNMLFILMAIELVFAGVVTAFIAVSHHVRTYNGQIFAVFVIMVAAAQAAVGVAIIVTLYRHRHSNSTRHWTSMKG